MKWQLVAIYHKVVAFKIIGDRRKIDSEFLALDMRRADFGLLRDPLGRSFGKPLLKAWVSLVWYRHLSQRAHAIPKC